MPSFTPDQELDLLFDPGLIPTSVKAELPSDLHVRGVERLAVEAIDSRCTDATTLPSSLDSTFGADGLPPRAHPDFGRAHFGAGPRIGGIPGHLRRPAQYRQHLLHLGHREQGE